MGTGMRLLEFFDHGYVVNLRHRADRRREMEREMERAGWGKRHERVEFFPAVRPSDAGGFPSIGAHGCYMSHLGLLRDALAKGYERVVVMEDDLAISKDFAGREEELTAELRRRSWDLVHMGHFLTLEGMAEKLGGDAFLETRETIVGLHFYAVHRRVLPGLIGFLELVLSRPPGHPDGGPMHVDGAYSTFRAVHPEVVTLVSVPSYGWQRSSRSDIAARQWFDRWWIARPAVEALRQWRNWSKR